jgi:hypothetical protein
MSSGEKGSTSTFSAPLLLGSSGLRNTINHYFQAALFLLVVTGFATLVSTGRLDTLTVAGVSAALLVRGYLMLSRRVWVIPERWTSYLTLLYVLFYAADLFFLSGSFVSASVHLVLFSMVVKIFSVQRDRDHIYLAILSFLEVLAAAVLTVDTVFLGVFCIFVLLAVATFIAMEMKRSAFAASGALPAPPLPDTSRRLVVSVSGVATLITVSVALLAGALFFILPRLSAGYLTSFTPHNEFVSGFSDHVQLGEIGRIQQTDTVVMHIQIDSDRGSHADLKWRGIALSMFDGREWSNPAGLSVEPRAGTGRYDLMRSQIRVRNIAAEQADSRPLRLLSGGSHGLSYRVVMEPLGTNVLFLAPVPISIAGSMREIGIDDNGAVYNLDRTRLTESYTAYSLMPQTSPGRLPGPSRDYPADITLNDLQLPRVDPRIRDLAAGITAHVDNDYDKALAIELYLRTQYGYSLQMASSRVTDPLVYFLFQRKEGHCEYFASAMAVMLRTLGIPARIVNGFRTGEYNDLTGSYIIRGRDAHTWVEVYVPGYAWVAFDPTPADANLVPGSMHRMLLYLDAMREFWREWVINYDFLHQRTLTVSALQRGRTLGDRGRIWFRRYYDSLLARALSLETRAGRAPRAWAAGVVAVLLVVISILNSRRLWRAARQFRLARNPERAPHAAASIWYTRMTRALGRQGFHKLPGQTPAEFVSTIPDKPMQQRVAEFTRHYEQARFGHSAADATRLRELYEAIKAK